MSDLASIAFESRTSSETMCRVSVLMRTYANENPQWLHASLESVFAQSVPPDQLVLVIDGPIGDDQEAVITQYQADPRITIVDLIRLPMNRGLAAAMNAGLEACTGEWIMLSYDICRANRLAIQLDYVDKYPDVDIFSSWSMEFSDKNTRIKASPIEHEAVVKALRWRNIIVHSTNLIRATTLRRVGGYRATYNRLEDYDLYVRLALAGALFRVIPAELVLVRALHVSAWTQLRFRIACWRVGFLTFRQCLIVTTTTTAYALLRVVATPLRGWKLDTPLEMRISDALAAEDTTQEDTPGGQKQGNT